MALQESIYSDTTLSDFSAALLKANDKDQNVQFKGGESVNVVSSNYYTSSANRSLSSILSQIQDDGPAYTESVKADNFINLMKKTTTSDSQQNAGLNNNDVLSATSSELQQSRITNADSSGTKTHPGIWFLFFLMLCVAVLLGLTVFKLDSRTSELEESLNLYDASMQGSFISQAQSEKLSLSIMNTNETLKLLQQELQLIKTDYADLGDKYAESISSGTSPQMDDVVSIKDSVVAPGDEILVLKTELQAVKTKFKPTNEDKSSADKTVARGSLTVNLVSLTNKNKVEKLAEQLQEAGLFPLIEQIVVKENRVYRLSVSGFSNRNKAEDFIRKAASLYGIKDGWIRKS